MLKMEVKSKLPPEKIVDKLKGFFGEGGLGLRLEDESAQCLSFHGGGGYVTATLCPEESKTSRHSGDCYYCKYTQRQRVYLGG